MARVAELIWKSDNRSVIRDLKQIAEQSEKTKGHVTRDSEQTARGFDRVRHSSSLLRDSVSGLAGMVGFGGLAFGLKDAIQGGMQLQAAQTQLQTALHGSRGAFQQLNAAAVAAATHGGFTTVQNVQTLAAFVRETHSASKAQQLFTLSTNIARGAHLDLATTQGLVASAYGGRARGLQRLLGPMVAAKDAEYKLTKGHREEILQLEIQSRAMGKLGPLWLKQQEIADGITPRVAALAQLQDKTATARQVISAAQVAFGGATSAFSGTTAGKMSNLQNSLKNLTDQIGVKLLPVVNRLAGMILSVVKVFSELPGGVQAAIVGMTAMGALAPFFRNMKGILSLFGGEVGLAGRQAATAGAEEAVGGAASAGGGGAGLLAGLAKRGALRGLLAAGGGALAASTIRQLTGIGNRHGHHSGAGSTIGTILGGGAGFLLGGPWGAAAGAGLGNLVGGLFAHGGVVPQYRAYGGPIGSDTVPAWLTPGEGILSLAGMRALGELNAGGMGSQEITIRVPVRLDSRVLTEAVAHYSLKRGARGPSSLVGGSLVTGATGLLG